MMLHSRASSGCARTIIALLNCALLPWRRETLVSSCCEPFPRSQLFVSQACEIATTMWVAPTQLQGNPKSMSKLKPRPLTTEKQNLVEPVTTETVNLCSTVFSPWLADEATGSLISHDANTNTSQCVQGIVPRRCAASPRLLQALVSWRGAVRARRARNSSK